MTNASITPDSPSPNRAAVAMSRTRPNMRLTSVPRLVAQNPLQKCRESRWDMASYRSAPRALRKDRINGVDRRQRTIRGLQGRACQAPCGRERAKKWPSLDRRLPKRVDLEKIIETRIGISRAHRKDGEYAVAERSKHQQKIIKNYYQNREAIGLQRLSELVSELYLAEGKARQRQWKHIATALEKLKVSATRIDHLVKKDDPALLAKLLEELLAKE